MAASADLALDAKASYWADKYTYEEAFEQHLSGHDNKLEKRVTALEGENATLKKQLQDLQKALHAAEARLAKLETCCTTTAPAASSSKPAAAPAKKEEKKEAAEDDFDLFGEDEAVDEEAEKVKAQRVAEYEAKKKKKEEAGKGVIAKSSILLDVKPWDDETDMVEMERLVRTIQADGLLWAAQAKLVPVGYGIKKLQIGCVVEDDKVGTDFLEDEITKFSDHVQSVDIAAFNKI